MAANAGIEFFDQGSISSMCQITEVDLRQFVNKCTIVP